MTTTPRHVVFGTGAIGLATLDALRHRGGTARLVNRSGHARVPGDVEVVAGDARDPAFTTEVARGAAVVYQSLNPPYAEWTTQFPLLQAGVLAAAEATGARLVSMENVYAYGRPAGRVLTEDLPHGAHTRKGRLRARMARELLAAHDAGRVEVAIGRVGLLRPARRRPVQPGRPRLPGRHRREDRDRAGRPRPAAHLHLRPRHLGAVTDDQETLELYHGHARDGRVALWVHTADDDVAKRAIRALADSPTLHIRHYGHRRQSDFYVQRPTS